MRTGYCIDHFEDDVSYKNKGDGESLQDGLSVRKPMRGPYEAIPSRVRSTDYFEPLKPEVD